MLQVENRMRKSAQIVAFAVVFAGLGASAAVGEKGFKNLFFDDQRLFMRENLRREMGHPEPIAAYQDPDYDTPLMSGQVFKCDDGKFRMVYMVLVDGKVDYQGNVVGADANGPKVRRNVAIALAESDDGVRFRPAKPHLVSDPSWDLGELACVVEDKKAPPAERYKALGCTKFLDDEFRHANYIMVSPDLVHWKKWGDVTWHEVGTEPITSCFWNPSQQAWTLLTRPQCGERRVGWSLTKDFKAYTPPQFCMQCDPEDEPLAELYGALGFEYDGWYVALPLLYGNQPQKTWWKGAEGTMIPHLAYSLNGTNFQRVFHEPFIDGSDEALSALTGRTCPMVWPACARRDADGSLLIYAVCDGFDHGRFFQGRRESWIVTYRLREDGFVKLVTENGNQVSRVCTRENLWRGGELTVNLSCRGMATVAVLVPNNADSRKANAMRCVAAGYSHNDCKPFVGDSTHWTPTWAGGGLDKFKGKSLTFEIRFWNGEIYSISGDMTPMMYVQARQWDLFKADPYRAGW